MPDEFPFQLLALHGRRTLRFILADTLGVDVSELLAAEAAARTYGALGRERGVSVNELVTALVRPLEESPPALGLRDHDRLMTRLTVEAVGLVEIGWQRSA